jgi:ABC-type amino acid transport substrate-binding protein/signal transduction histidine kinase
MKNGEKKRKLFLISIVSLLAAAFLLLSIFILYNYTSNTSSQNNNSTITFTPEEKEFINNNPELRVSNEMDWPPFDFVVDNQPQGYSIEIMDLLSEKVGIRFNYVNGFTWDELWNMFLEGDIDIIHCLYPSVERERVAFLLPPIYYSRSHFIIRDDTPEITDVSQLAGKTVALPRGWLFVSYIEDTHPDVNVLVTNNTIEAYDAVLTGDAVATIDLDASARYMIRKNMMDQLKLSGWFRDYDGGNAKTIHTAVKKENRILYSILEKGFNNISLEEMEEIREKWIGSDIADEYLIFQSILTEEEKAYLKQKRIIRMAVTPDWMPIEAIDESGNLNGMTSDYIELFEQKLGVAIKLVPTDSWVDSLYMVRNQIVDILPLAMKTENRTHYLDFTEPYLKFYNVVVTRNNDEFIEDLSRLKNKQIGVVKGFAAYELLNQQYPELVFIEVDTIETGLSLIRAGELFAFVDAFPTVSYYLNSNGFDDLKISTRIDFEYTLSVATRKDEPILNEIFNKLVLSINEMEHQRIRSKWIAIRYDQKIDYRLFRRILLGAFVLIVIIFLWNRKLANLNTKISDANSQLNLILDNSGQGFLTFNSDLKVNEHYSKECLNIFGEKISNKNLDEILYPGKPDEQVSFKKNMNRILTEKSDYRQKLYISLMDSDFKIVRNNKEFHYQGEIKVIGQKSGMLILTNVTKELELIETLTSEQKNHAFIVRFMKDEKEIIPILKNFFELFNREEIDTEFKTNKSNFITNYYRHTHTYKGLFSQYDFPYFPDLLHKLESEIVELKEDQDADKIKELFVRYNLTVEIEKDLEILYDIYGSDILKEEINYTVTEEQLDEIENRIINLLIQARGDAKKRLYELKEEFQSIRKINLKEKLGQFVLLTHKLANRQNKKIKHFEITGDDVYLLPELYENVINSIVHIFRNVVTHGIEYPDVREALGKSSAGNVSCSIEKFHDQFIITISDDGGGLNKEKIISTALKNQLISEEESSNVTQDLIVQILFSDGFSTSSASTMTAGRGMGLTALKSEVDKIGGKIQLSSEDGSYTTFKIILPYLQQG